MCHTTYLIMVLFLFIYSPPAPMLLTVSKYKLSIQPLGQLASTMITQLHQKIVQAELPHFTSLLRKR